MSAAPDPHPVALPDGSDEAGWDGPLPDAVRARVVTLAADTLGGLAEDDVLVRTTGWAALVAAAAEAAERAVADAGTAAAEEQLTRLEAQLEAERERHRAEAAALRAEVEAAVAEAAAVAKELREEKGARRRAERAAAEAAEAVEAAEAAASSAMAAAGDAVHQAQRRVEEAEAALEASRRAVREGRSLEDTRVRLLLDTVVDAASALRRELALPPVQTRPADLVEAAAPGSAGASEGFVLSDDPGLLDKLVSLPQAHLVVDGYNVTKTGFPELSLEKQRTRLLMGLSNLAARSGAEVTCCFDGAALEGRVPAASARGVRVLFSKAGETADELIRRLVRAEPDGRPVCVVSSDREVVDGVRRAGARAVSAAALVKRLDRA